MGVERTKARAETLKPFATQPLRGAGEWNGVTGTRFAMPLPETAQGPIRARAARQRKLDNGAYGQPPSVMQPMTAPSTPKKARRRG